MGKRETRTQEALVAALRARPRTPCRAGQCVLVAKASIFNSLIGSRTRPFRCGDAWTLLECGQRTSKGGLHAYPPDDCRRPRRRGQTLRIPALALHSQGHRPPLRFATRRLVRRRGGWDLRRPGDGAAPRLRAGRRWPGRGGGVPPGARHGHEVDPSRARLPPLAWSDAGEAGRDRDGRGHLRADGFRSDLRCLHFSRDLPSSPEGAGRSHLLSAIPRRAGRVRRTNIRSRPGRSPRRARPGQ